MTTSPTTSGKFSPPGLFLGGIKCLNPEKNKKNENLKKFYSFWFFFRIGGPWPPPSTYSSKFSSLGLFLGGSHA